MKHSILLAFILITVAGCNQNKNHKETNEPPRLIRAFKNSGNWDSVYVYSDGHLIIINKEEEKVNKRFFFVSYQYSFKKFTGMFGGNLWFSVNGFPSKKDIDSIVYDGLPYKKSCYQPILITSIYEFKSEEDYLQFDYKYTGNQKSIKNKKSCNQQNEKINFTIIPSDYSRG